LGANATFPKFRFGSVTADVQVWNWRPVLESRFQRMR